MYVDVVMYGDVWWSISMYLFIDSLCLSGFIVKKKSSVMWGKRVNLQICEHYFLGHIVFKT